MPRRRRILSAPTGVPSTRRPARTGTKARSTECSTTVCTGYIFVRKPGTKPPSLLISGIVCFFLGKLRRRSGEHVALAWLIARGCSRITRDSTPPGNSRRQIGNMKFRVENLCYSISWILRSRDLSNLEIIFSRPWLDLSEMRLSRRLTRENCNRRDNVIEAWLRNLRSEKYI